MQDQPNIDPTSPPDPAPSKTTPTPAPAKSTAIPAGIAGGVHDDPGLAPGVRQPDSVPQPGTLEPDDRSTQFVPVTGGEDSTSAMSLLVSAYLVMWALLMLFVFFSWRRQQQIEGRVGQLEKQLEAAEASEE